MKSRKRIAFAAIAAAGLVAPLGLTMAPAQADSDAGYLIGIVTDSAGHPVAGADVTATSTSGDDASGSTNRNGRYVVTFSRYDIADGGTWTLSASADGLVDSAPQAVTGPARGQNLGGPTVALAPDAYTEDLTDVALTGAVTTPYGLAHSGFAAAYDAATGRVIDYATIEPNGHYYFYGSSTPSDYSVAGRSVKLDFYVDGFVETFYGGGLAKSKSPAVAVPAYGQAPATVNGAVTAEGTITGAVKLPAAGANWEASVTIYDLDGNPIAGSETDAAGNFSADVAPGTYYVRADGDRFTEYVPTGSTTPDVADTFGFVAGYYGKKATSLATASKVVVGANQNRSVGTITLTNALHAIEKPFIKVKKGIKKGGKLSVNHGTWNHQSNVVYSYAWKVGKKTVGTKAHLKLTKKVWKKKLKNGKKAKKLTVTVTATDRYGKLVNGSSKQKVVKTLAKEQKQANKDAKKAQKKANKVKKHTSK